MRTRSWGVLILGLAKDALAMAFLAMAFLAIAASVDAGGEGRFESVLKDLVGALDKLTTALGGIRDEDSAKAALPELRKIAAQWQALMKKAEDAAPPTKEVKDRLEKAYAAKLTEARRKLLGEVERVREVAGGREALKEISGVLARKSKK